MKVIVVGLGLAAKTHFAVSIDDNYSTASGVQYVLGKSEINRDKKLKSHVNYRDLEFNKSRK